MKRFSVAAALVVACNSADRSPPRDGHAGPKTSSHASPSSTKQACDRSLTVSLVLTREGSRADLDKRLDEGVVFVAMPSCDGEFVVVEGCRLAGSYRPASEDVVTQVDKVRTEEDASTYVGGGKALAARPAGFDVAMRGTVLRLDPKSMGDDPKGDRCGDVTHIVTGAMRGSFKLGAADSSTEPPDAGKDVSLIVVHLRSINARGAKPPSEHEQTGIIAPH